MGRADGGMAAVVGLDEEQIRSVLQENNFTSIDIANLNSPTQIVISGPKAAIEDIQAVFTQIKAVKMFVPLKKPAAHFIPVTWQKPSVNSPNSWILLHF